MKLFKILLVVLLFTSCQKDSITYKSPPKVTLKVSNITAKSCELTGFATGNDNVIRGFLISKYNVPGLSRPDNTILWASRGFGQYVITPELEHNQVYWVVSFCYYERRAGDVSYSDAIAFKTL